ncbi:MAG: superoxide dismutase family protein [Pseudomonadota bacterium]
MDIRLIRCVAAGCTLAALTLPAFGQSAEQIEVAVARADGTTAGTVIFREVAHGVVMTARLRNLPEGPHGFHIHERGACEPPDFDSAGGHYAPQGHSHGFDNPEGYHAGDLPNVHVAADGTAQAEFFAPRLTLRADAADPDEAPFSLDDQDGSAVMVHADVDDYRADPAGSTGSRIACGVIFPAER